MDSVGIYQLAFWPRPGLSAADWEGTLTFETGTGLLRETFVRLVGIPAWSSIQPAECRTRYQEVFPALVLEDTLDCETVNARAGAERRVVDARQLLGFRFVKRVPGTESPP